MEKNIEQSVYIQSLKIRTHFLFSPCEINFSEPNGVIGSGINYIVGESGSGKTRLLELLTSRFLSKKYIPTGVPQVIPSRYFQQTSTAADFEVKMKSNPQIVDVSLIREVPTSGKFTYIPNSYLTTKGEDINYKRVGKTSVPYLITEESLGTGEFSFDCLRGFFNKAISDSYKIFIIEEPEYAKDPILQVGLMKIIAEVAKNNQVFITTHSPIIIDWNYIKSGASIIKLSRTGEETTIGRYAGDIPEFLIKTTKAHLAGIESKSFLFSNKVCVVEGQEDVGYLQAYFAGSLHGNQFSNPEFVFFGYGTNGHGDISDILEICADLKIPKVVAIYDGDQPTEKSYEKATGEQKYKTLGYKITRFLAPDIRNKIERNTGNEIIGIFEKTDGSTVKFSENKNFQIDFEIKMKEVFEFFSG